MMLQLFIVIVFENFIAWILLMIHAIFFFIENVLLVLHSDQLGHLTVFYIIPFPLFTKLCCFILAWLRLPIPESLLQMLNNCCDWVNPLLFSLLWLLHYEYRTALNLKYLASNLIVNTLSSISSGSTDSISMVLKTPW